MDTLIKADIFFFISSLAVVLVTAALMFLFFKVRKILNKTEELFDVLEHNIEDAGDELSSLASDIRESTLYRTLFRRRRKKRPQIEETNES